MSATLRVGQVGAEIVVQFTDPAGAAVDVSGASTLQIRLQPPGANTASVLSASLLTDGTDGRVVYRTTNTTLSVVGAYQIEGYASWGTYDLPTEIGRFDVGPVLT